MKYIIQLTINVTQKNIVLWLLEIIPFLERIHYSGFLSLFNALESIITVERAEASLKIRNRDDNSCSELIFFFLSTSDIDKDD